MEFADGEIWLGSMPGAVKALDLRRDPRFALHSPTVDPPVEDPAAWPGEAKLAGVAVEAAGGGVGEPHRFRLDVTEIVLVTLSGARLHIQAWHPGRGHEHHWRD